MNSDESDDAAAGGDLCELQDLLELPALPSGLDPLIGRFDKSLTAEEANDAAGDAIIERAQSQSRHVENSTTLFDLYIASVEEGSSGEVGDAVSSGLNGCGPLDAAELSDEVRQVYEEFDLGLSLTANSIVGAQALPNPLNYGSSPNCDPFVDTASTLLVLLVLLVREIRQVPAIRIADRKFVRAKRDRHGLP